MSFKIDNKHIRYRSKAFYCFLKIYGLSLSFTFRIIKYSGFKKYFNINRLNRKSIALTNMHLLFKNIEYLLEDSLKQYFLICLKQFMESKSFRSYRFSLGYPTYGQRTHSNACTSKKTCYLIS